MKRRSYGGGRWKREAGDEQPLMKAMKHEGLPEGEEEELEVEEEEEGLQQQQDPMPMVFSLLAASQRRNGNKNNLKDPRYSNYHERRDKIFNAQLIQEVSRHPALFDFTTEEYKSIEARNRHWEEVSSRVEQPLEFVRTRWKTLRDRFKKEVRRVQSNQPGIAWQHYEEMLYLLPFVRDKLLEEVPFRGDGIEQQHQHNKQRAAKGTARGQVVDEHLAVVQQQQMNSCTAAILDLAMSAVNSRYSPPPPSSSRRSTSPASTNTNNESALHDHFGTNGGGTEYAGGTSSSAGGGATAFINSGTRLRTFPPAEQAQQNGGAQRKQSSSNNNNKGAAEWMAENGGGADEEDQLFCRIVLKKLGRLEERVKEKAKAKIMEMLVEMQYGEANKKSG